MATLFLVWLILFDCMCFEKALYAYRQRVLPDLKLLVQGWSLIGYRYRHKRWSISVSLEFKLADLWVGAYWQRFGKTDFEIWVCVVPMFPVHVSTIE